MIDYIRHHLGVKLLLSYIAILIVIVIVMVIVIPFSAPYAYNHFMMETGTLPGTGMMGQGAMGLGRGQGQGLANFRNSMFEALSYAILAATIVVALISLFFSRSVVAPLRKMTFASQRVATGK